MPKTKNKKNKKNKNDKKNKKLTVLRTIESFYPYMSGPANQAYRISKELEARGIRSPLLTSNYKAGNSPMHERKNGVEVFRFPIKWKFMKYFVTPDMKTMFNERFADFDIVHAHSYRGYQTELAYKMARKMGKKFILHNHGSLLGYKSFVRGWRKLPYLVYDIFHRRIALDADAVIVNTRQELEEVVRFGVNKKKIHIIPVGIDSSEYRPKKKNWKELRLLFVGRISRDRNLEPVIEAVKILVDKGIDVKLRVVGGAEKRTDTQKGDYLLELRHLVKNLGIEKNVDFVGPKYGAELREYYKTSDIFVYTSLWENFGQTILEAAAAGLPLVCTRVGVALDLIKEGKTGYFVDKKNPEQISNKISSLILKNKIDPASKMVRNLTITYYAPNRVLKKYIELYKACSK